MSSAINAEQPPSSTIAATTLSRLDTESSKLKISKIYRHPTVAAAKTDRTIVMVRIFFIVKVPADSAIAV